MTAHGTELSAHSDDGRSFVVGDATGSRLIPGTFVVIAGAGSRQLALVEERSDGEPVRLRGRLLGDLASDGIDPRTSHPFDRAAVELADAATVQLLHDRTGAVLDIGTDLSAPGRPVRVLPTRFNRHTFWCGQSGSGKTYALGVVLEQLIAHTALPMVIFDPNSDFVRLGDVRPEARGATAQALRDRDIRVLRARGRAGTRLCARFLSMPLASKAAILRLDPVADREEFNELLHLGSYLEAGPTLDAHEIENALTRLRETGGAAARRLAMRVENLGLSEWEVWAGGDPAVTEIVAERPDVTVLELGGFSTPEQHLVVALALLDELWDRREERRPLLLVIDEAHNLASPRLDSPVAVAVRERLIQIAAEGRKFGLWLLLSTQRPSRVHPGIISQCDNLALMKMTSPADLTELGTYFGYVPRALLARSPWFRQGEALFAGGFVPAPALVKIQSRLTYEGGGDVDVPLR